jgi:hypothetical protein
MVLTTRMTLWTSRFVRALGRGAVPLLVLATLIPQSALGQVLEPNGVAAPRIPSTNGETSLQEYFDTEGEAINAVLEASAEPGTFSPLCEFTATVVMSEAEGLDGLAWYNVPADATSAPPRVFPIVPETNRVTGMVFSGVDIRNSPDYAGGLIGFVLTHNGGQPIYYSEYRRNAECTQCAVPGHWKMMLAYRSTLHQSSYYLGFEDWPGADQRSWYDNDGDFQDKVFLVTGVSCPGGGEPCDTGQQGLCAAGLSECSVNGTPTCKPQHTPRAEECDNVDNDCNGRVDDGDLCPGEQVCLRGKCVGRCNTGEFQCVAPLVCGDDGFCIDASCKNVTCQAGLACRDGKCVGACEGVVCPLGRLCRLGSCVDPCAGVTCPERTFCERGVCVGDCTCNGCPGGGECGKNGRCAAPGCADVTCPAGQGCRDGQCVSACDGAVCPGGAACTNGTCEAPVSASGGTGGAPGMATGGALVVMISGGKPNGFSGTAGQPQPSPTGSQPSPSGAGKLGLQPVGDDDTSSCTCRVAPSTRWAELGAVPFALLGLLLARRRAPVRRGSDRAA